MVNKEIPKMPNPSHKPNLNDMDEKIHTHSRYAWEAIIVLSLFLPPSDYDYYVNSTIITIIKNQATIPNNIRKKIIKAEDFFFLVFSC
jgi:hypothetical protein